MIVDMISSNDKIMSCIRDEPAPELVYSLLSAYGQRRGGELPGAWFVATLDSLGYKPAAVRQTLFRMTRAGILVARQNGRMSWYRLSDFGQAAIATGAGKLFDPPPPPWDGRWTLVVYQFETAGRARRDQVREILALEGFALLGRGVYIHPYPRTDRVLALIESARLKQRVLVFRADRLGEEPALVLAARLWDLSRLDRGYREFLQIFEPLLSRRPQTWRPADAFTTRLAVVLKYLQTAWDDPGLPSELLPARWKGQRARQVAHELYDAFLPGTLQHGDAVAEQVGVADLVMRHVAASLNKGVETENHSHLST
jgi:phenylacetic acid degradation operon negative regulatory protein